MQIGPWLKASSPGWRQETGPRIVCREERGSGSKCKLGHGLERCPLAYDKKQDPEGWVEVWRSGILLQTNFSVTGDHPNVTQMVISRRMAIVAWVTAAQNFPSQTGMSLRTILWWMEISRSTIDIYATLCLSTPRSRRAMPDLPTRGYMLFIRFNKIFIAPQSFESVCIECSCFCKR
jgi:hypothetical protein